MSEFFPQHTKSRGAAALITVVVISASALLMAYGASILGLGELEMGYDSARGDETLALADSCREEAFYRLRLDPNYIGGSLSATRGSCIIEVEENGEEYTLLISATTGYYTKHLQATAKVASSTITALTWKQI